MTTVKQTGTTVEVAIEKALEQLNVSRNEVEIDVLTQGRKGFFGIGAREAKVRLTVKPKVEPEVKESPVQLKEQQKKKAEEILDEQEVNSETRSTEEIVEVTPIVEEEKNPIAETVQYLTKVAKEMQIDDLQVSHEVDGKYVYFQLESKKAALLIGKRGQTLNALQQLAQLVANQHAKQFKVVRLNVGDYRERREQSLAHLAERMADKAIQTGRKVQLEPMPAYERKVIHHTLSNRMDVETRSEGSDPHRYLVIGPI